MADTMKCWLQNVPHQFLAIPSKVWKKQYVEKKSLPAELPLTQNCETISP